MKRIIIAVCIAATFLISHATDPIHGLMERLSPGLSAKIDIEVLPGDSIDWFGLSQNDDRPLIRANSQLSAAVGLFHYLCEYCSARPGWMQRHLTLPHQLPPVTTPVTRRCKASHRYYLNYCTYSYSMAFWDRDRWQQEIDWMALHGINMPLALEGTATVWRNTLRRLRYPEEAISQFVAGPAFQAWWLMNNLEGWGGPVPEDYYERQAALQQDILAEMRAWGMNPVLPGYSGMVPHDASSVLGIPTADSGEWLGFIRPAFINPASAAFEKVADIYYEEQIKLYGKARYYSMDPFHEGGSTQGLDLGQCGLAIYNAMQRHAPDAVWLLQGWQANPRAEMIENLPPGAAILLDLQAENEPMWQLRADIFSRRPWLYCMLLNFGGNEGLYGKAEAMTKGYEKALAESSTLCGIGLTMEAIENNPVMFDLITELPWMNDCNLAEWLKGYVNSSYGKVSQPTLRAWELLMASVYNSPADSVQQGTTESLFCARPADRPRQASAWAAIKDYYHPEDVIQAAQLLLADGQVLSGSGAYRYDAVNVTRQAVAECGRKLLARIDSARLAGNTKEYRRLADNFLALIDIQDSITAMHPSMRLSTLLQQACNAASVPADTLLWQENALRLVTTWGPRIAADNGNLHDYSHREWSGLLGGLYRLRWATWFESRINALTASPPMVDFYTIEENWISKSDLYVGRDIDFSVESLRHLLEAALRKAY